MSSSDDCAVAPSRRQGASAGWRTRSGLLALVALLIAPLPLSADRDEDEGEAHSSALEPTGVAADAPYQVRGVVEWIDQADKRIVVDGKTYRYTSPRVHRPPGAPGKEDLHYETPRLRPGMTVGLNVGRGDPRPVLEVWILR